MQISNKKLLGLSITGLASLLTGCGEAQKQEKGEGIPENPNMVFVLADDLGWQQIGCYGSNFYETPNIDKLAEQGMQFTNAYSGAAVSSPTRASLMTGKHPGRLHLTDFIDGDTFPGKPLRQPDWQKYLPLKEKTLGELFKQKNYHTAWFGKWHLSKAKTPPQSRSHNPVRQGFDKEFVTYKPYPEGYPVGAWQQSGEDPHSVDTLTDLTTNFIRKHQDEPFFVGVSHNTIHDPLKEDKERIEYYKNKAGADKPRNHPVIGAMIETLDKSVGRIMELLEELDLKRNTLLIFYSDNGGKKAYATQNPFRAGKGWLYEGGIRVPLIVRYPGVVPENSVTHELVTSHDFYPTFLEWLDLKQQQQSLDGVSILPLLTDDKDSLARKSLYWHYPHYHSGSGMKPAGAMRQGPYKMVVWYEKLLMEQGNAYELYHVKKDPSESNNLAEEHPEKLREMKKSFKQWRRRANVQMPSVRAAKK